MKRFRYIASVLVLLACLFACGFSAAEEEERVIEKGVLAATLPVQGAQVEIRSTCIDGEEWLFLPAFADMGAMALSLDNQPVLWQDVQQEEEGVWLGQAVCGEEMLFDLRVMRSENLRALFLISDDPQEQGRDYIEGGGKHDRQTTGAMAIVDIDGKVDHADRLRQLRGRGNYSWQLEKKPYQFKLENRADLLKTGDAAESNRTWVLLAEVSDGTMLNNRIAMDLGLEIGIGASSHSEHVDLYYDGEYRGLYLLSEKVEPGEGRLNVDSYDDIIKALNESAGIRDMEALDVEYADHEQSGQLYAYISGLAAPEDPADGTYVLEMEGANTLTDRCWFQMPDGSTIALKDPENASQEMMLYISTRLLEARRTLQDGGVNAENGRTIHDDFNVDAFARLLLLNELCYNADNYTYSSSWFILPAGETRFEPGTPWDFDVGMRYRRDGTNAGGMGLRTDVNWPMDFYRCDDFARAMKEIYLQDISPVVETILLGDQPGSHLKPLDHYVQQIAASRRMNDRIWSCYPYAMYLYEEDFESEVNMLRRFLTERHAWLKEALEAASPDTAEVVTLWGRADYGHVDGDLQVYACAWNNVRVASCAWEQIEEATEEDYALWQLEAVIAPEEGYAFENPTVTFGGKEISYEMQEDGTLRILVTFEDPSYRPVDYYGEDIGLIYNPDVYAQNYPEIAAEYEGDPEGMMNYFCDDGMYEDQMGNAFFKPSEVLHHNQDLNDILGTDWQLYYWDFLYYGYSDGWLRPGGGRGFALDVTDALISD